TATINIDYIRTSLFCYLSSSSHPIFCVPEELNRDRSLLLFEEHHTVCLEIVAREPFGADKLSDNKSYATAMLYQLAKSRIGNTGHWRKDKVRSYSYISN